MASTARASANVPDQRGRQDNQEPAHDAQGVEEEGRSLYHRVSPQRNPRINFSEEFAMSEVV